MVSCLPLLVVLDVCTTFARLDLGIVRGVYRGVVCAEEILEVTDTHLSFRSRTFLYSIGLSLSGRQDFEISLAKDPASTQSTSISIC